MTGRSPSPNPALRLVWYDVRTMPLRIPEKMERKKEAKTMKLERNKQRTERRRKNSNSCSNAQTGKKSGKKRRNPSEKLLTFVLRPPREKELLTTTATRKELGF